MQSGNAGDEVLREECRSFKCNATFETHFVWCWSHTELHIFPSSNWYDDDGWLLRCYVQNAPYPWRIQVNHALVPVRGEWRFSAVIKSILRCFLFEISAFVELSLHIVECLWFVYFTVGNDCNQKRKPTDRKHARPNPMKHTLPFRRLLLKPRKSIICLRLIEIHRWKTTWQLRRRYVQATTICSVKYPNGNNDTTTNNNNNKTLQINNQHNQSIIIKTLVWVKTDGLLFQCAPTQLATDTLSLVLSLIINQKRL